MSFCLYFADAAALVFPSDHVPSFAAPPVPAARATAALRRRGVLRARTRSHGRRPQCRHRKCETVKLEGEQPEVSDGLAQAWADYTPGLLDWMKSLDPKFQAFATPGFKGAAFPNFPGAKECGYQVYKASYPDRIRPMHKSTWG